MHATTIISFITISLATLATAAPVDPVAAAAETNSAVPTPTAAATATAGGPSPRSAEEGLAPRGVRAACNYKNAIFIDVFTIYGKEFGGPGPGKGGEHIRNNLKGCGGTMTGFKFQSGARDEAQGHWWDWQADFSLPVFQSRCVANVVATVGGGRISCDKFN